MSGQIISPPKRIRAGEARAGETVYQAQTQGVVEVVATMVLDNAFVHVLGLSDANNPPTTVVMQSYHRNKSSGTELTIKASFVVEKGNYWKVTIDDGSPWIVITSVSWRPNK